VPVTHPAEPVEASAGSLSAAVGRLRPESVDIGAPALSVMSGALAPGEAVLGVVTGRARGMPCAVAVTDRRILVVADRQPRPVVQSLHPLRTGLEPLRQVPTGPLSLLVRDAGRVLEVTAVGDPEIADALAQPGSAVSPSG
jgi:hypothetical protein